MTAIPIVILHLEDSDLDAELILARLGKAGYVPDLDRATNREEFVAALEKRPHDLILADYSLPTFDGLSALEIARETVPDTPFIFVSGMLGEEVAIDTLKSGATDYVLKQRLERLAPAVRRALGESRERADRLRAESALRAGEVRHRLIIDSIKDYAVIATDAEGVVEGWSAGAAALFGRPESEALGRPIDLIFTPEEVAAGVPRRELQQARDAGRGADERWHTRADGSRFWGNGVVVPLLDDAGTLLGFAKVVRDMTERKRAEDALRDADRRKDEFLAMLAHELRNPLSAVNYAVQIARRPSLPPDRLDWATGIIAHQVKHLARLVDDLLDVSRITRGKIRLRKEPVDLAAVVSRVMEASRTLVEERRHTLSVSVEPGPLRAQADPTRIEQVVVNLLTNASRYTEKGGKIALTCRREGGDAVLRVRDNGVGMTPEMLERAFDLFTQADDSLDRTTGGLGIGLTVARRLAELHGGSLTGKSDGPGLGSEFELRLPLDEVTDPSHPGEVEPAPDGIAATRVLIVDDNVYSASTLADLLRTSGHDVSLAYDGGEALDVARKTTPDVVLLDIGLPVLDGYQVAERLRLDETVKDALLIAITGYGGDQAVGRSRQAGFDHHLVKPVDYDQLLAMIAREVRPPRGRSASAG